MNKNKIEISLVSIYFISLALSLFLGTYQSSISAELDYSLVDQQIINDLTFTSAEAGALGKAIRTLTPEKFKRLQDNIAEKQEKALHAAYFRCCDNSVKVCDVLKKVYSKNYEVFNKDKGCSNLLKTQGWKTYKQTGNIPSL